MKRPGPRSDRKHRPAGRGRGILPGPRWTAAALGLAGAVLAGPAAGAQAASNQMVSATIYQPGSASGITRSVSLSALAQGCTGYAGPDAVLSPSGITYVFPQSSWSLRTVLECGLNQSVAAITAVAVQRPSGAWEDPLTSADLSATGDFAVGQAVPVVSDDGTGIVYTRPQRTPAENNAGDQVIHPDPLSLAVYEGPLLTVTVQPGSETVTAGTAVSFTAGVTDAHGSPVDPASLSYTWSLDGTPSAQSQRFSQTFASAGRYTITATANDDQGGGGADTVQITVGSSQNATPGPQNSNSPGTTKLPTAPAIGPQQSAGTHPGATRGPAKPKQTTPASKPPAVRQPSATQPKTTTVKPAAPAPTAATPTGHTASPITRPPHGVTPPAGPGAVISGRLVSNVTLLPADASPLVKVVPANTAAAPPVQRPVRASILPALAGVLAVVGLLALGAANQLRWRLRPGRRLVAG